MAIYWFETLVYLIFIFLWTKNRCKHKLISVKMHTVIHICCSLHLAFAIAQSIILTIYEFRKPFHAVKTGIDIIECFKTFVLSCLSLFLASGLSIVFDKITPITYMMIFTSAGFFNVMSFVLSTTAEVYIPLWLSIILCIFYVGGYMYYFGLILYLERESLNALKTHLILIAERNIDPKTTPSYRKLKLLTFARNASISMFFVIVICFILYFSTIAPYWLVTGLQCIAMAILYGIVMYMCRIRNAMASTYFDDEDAYVVDDDDNEKQNWERGMKLPPMPQAQFAQNKISGKFDD